MGRPLVLEFGGAQAAFSLQKVSRSSLYGYVEEEVLDDSGHRVSLAKVAADGRTLLGSGGVALGWMTQDGEWLDRAALKPVDAEGNPVVPSKSSFDEPVKVEAEADVDEFFTHTVRGVYLLRSEGQGFAGTGPLMEAVRAGKVYKFPFSYRKGSVETDTAFILANAEGDVFLALGRPTKVRFVGLETAAVEEENGAVAEADAEEGDLDFGML